MSGADLRYSAEVRQRFRELPGAGDLPDGEGAVLRASAGDTESGAQVQLAIRIGAGTIQAARFMAYGCPHFLAAASWLCERLAGAPRADLETWDWREAAAALDVPPAKFGRLLTLQDAVRGLACMWSDAPLDSV